jgi:hypothetical protein
MDLHKFDGQNLSAWMFQLHQCFIYYNTPSDLHKYMFASYQVEGEALTWLETMERSGVFTMDAVGYFCAVLNRSFHQPTVQLIDNMPR